MKAEKLFDALLYVLLIAAGAVTLYPFINVLAISLNDAVDASRGGIYLWPREFTLGNYGEIFKYPDLATSFLISVMRTVAGTVVCVISVTLLAYVLSRKDFSGKKPITLIFLITMYIDGGIIPNFLLIKTLKLYNSFWVYILPGLVGVFYILIVRTYIESLGTALQESAMIDGANDLIIFTRIIFPLCLPVVATVALYSAVSQWNSWFDTYIYTDGGPGFSTLQFQLMKILQSTTLNGAVTHVDKSNAPKVTPESIRMTITIIATVPILCVYPFLQKYFVKGMMIGAIKS